MDWSNPEWVLRESSSLEKRFGELEKAGEEQEVPLSLLPGWTSWAEENCTFESELRRVLGEKGRVSFSTLNYDGGAAVFLAWRRSREQMDIPVKERGRIGELVRDELARLCAKDVEYEFKDWEQEQSLVAGDRIRSWFHGDGPAHESVVLKPGRCGWCYFQDVVETGGLIRKRGRGEGLVKAVCCGECIMSGRVERALWDDERLRDAEVRRQYPSAPPGYRRRRRFRRGPDVVVGDVSWFVDVGELDTLTGNEQEGWRPALAVVVRMELEVMARKVSGRKAEEDECIVREVWRSDGEECREFSVKAFELAMFSSWRVPWKDEKERRSLQRMEELERDLAYMQLFCK